MPHNLLSPLLATIAALGLTAFTGTAAPVATAPAVVAPAAAAPAAPAARSAVLSLEGGLWFDGTRFWPDRWYVVDGRFTKRRPARLDARIDLSGRHVIPPLAEAHEHDIQGSWAVEGAVRKYLAAGVFYSLQMCGNPEDLKGVREGFGHPGTLDVAFASACISASDGHPLGMALTSVRRFRPDVKPEDLHDKAYFTMDDAADVERKWAAIAAARPDLVKIILVESERFAARKADPANFGGNGLDPALVRPIVERAHRDKLRVAAHVETVADLRVAVDGGVDVIAHLPGNRMIAGTAEASYRIPDALAADMARRGTAVVTTASVLTMRKKGVDELRRVHADNLRTLRRHGVRIAFGTDTYTRTVVSEIEYVDGLDAMPRADLLRIATRDTPRLIFPGRRIGAFEEGAEASLIALEGDPLTDLGALSRVRLRLKQGSLLAPPTP